jgi:hypothetical protein
VTAIDRIPQRRLKKLTDAQRRAYDLLVYHKASPADRARAKVELGLRPSRQESLALTRELLSAGASVAAIADSLAVTDRSARRLIAEARRGGLTLGNRPVFPLNHEPPADIIDAPKGITCPGPRIGWEMYAGQPGYPFERLLRQALRGSS